MGMTEILKLPKNIVEHKKNIITLLAESISCELLTICIFEILNAG